MDRRTDKTSHTITILIKTQTFPAHAALNRKAVEQEPGNAVAVVSWFNNTNPRRPFCIKVLRL